MRQSFRIFFCGEGIALAAALECARQRGHDVTAVFATSPDEAAVIRRSSTRVADPGMALDEFAVSVDYDVLISINNGRLLTEATIRRARVSAINYHNAPLPAYAGLRATAWAVLNGEQHHGITWHLIEPGIDTGHVILQKRVTLSPEETTARLNARCTDAAVDSLTELFSMIEGGSLGGVAQDFAGRSYYRRTDTVPAGGVLNWRWDGGRIIRLIRACDWGGVANDFGTPTILRSQGPPCHAVEGWFEPVQSLRTVVPGTVLARTGDRIRVVCADGSVTLRIDPNCNLATDEQLPIFDEETIGRLADIHGKAIAAEPRWLPALRILSQRADSGVDVPLAAVASEEGQSRHLQAIDRILGGGAVVAVQAQRQSALMSDYYPVFARGFLASDAPGLLLDVHRRYPGIAALGAWWRRCDFRIDLKSSEPALATTARNRLIIEAVKATALELAAEESATAPAFAHGLLPQLRLRAGENPDFPAIEDGDRSWTRRELVERATALASRLIAAKLKRRAGVGILLPRGADYIVASLAAMLAGGAYVPLNLDSPEKRRFVETTDAGITHLITDRTRIGTLPDLHVDVLDADAPVPYLTRQLTDVGPDDSAYRIFTSGSTGRPKAVDVTHAALANLIQHYRDRLHLRPADRMTFLSHPTFDASVADIWPVLCAGGTLLIPPPHILLDPLGLVDWLHATRASLAFVPTAIGSRLMKLRWPHDLSLRTLLVGGEKLHHRPSTALPFELINTYGPTENTVDSLWAVVEPGEGAPPIGTPIAGVCAEVLDPSGVALSPGETGELALGGRQLARGYFGRPDLTALRFDVGSSGSRRYRTGDLVRLNHAGEFEFLGRVDNQVQMRGIRIEPGEIEAILYSDPRVREAVCVPEYDDEEVTALAVHVTTTIQGPELASDLKALLEAHLVPMMVPRTIVIRNELPRTAAGKTDRAALTRSTVQKQGEPEVGDLERLWKDALALNTNCDSDRSFWDLGGTSLGAMKLLLAVQGSTGSRIPIASFLAAPTFRGLEALVHQRPAATVLQLRNGVGTPVVLWYGLSGDLEEYRHLIDQDLGGRPVLGVLSPVLVTKGRIPETLEAAVRAGITALRAHGVTGAPAMLGFSWGGLLAFEAARQLVLSGNPANFVGIIGTHPPLVARGRVTRTLHFLRWMPIVAYRRWRLDRAFQIPDMLRRMARLLGPAGATPHPIDWPSPIYEAHVQLGYGYRPNPKMPINLFLVRDLDAKTRIDPYGYIRFNEPDLGWARWTSGRVTVNWLPGDHLSLALGTHAAEFAVVLKEAMKNT